MAKEPDIWMPLYISDYLVDTRHLTTLEHGAYLLLLMTYWKNQGPLPDDDIRLSRYASLTMKQWKKIRPTLAEFFQIGEGQWKSTRAESELFNAKKRSASASANALERWKTADAGASNPQSARNADGYAEPMRNGCSSPSHTHEEESLPSEAHPISPEKPLFDTLAEIDPAERIVIAWNLMAGTCGLPQVKNLTTARKASIARRLKESGGSVTQIETMIATIPQSTFLTGGNDRGWRADFDFMLQPSSFTKLMEGRYADQSPKPHVNSNGHAKPVRTRESDRETILRSINRHFGPNVLEGDGRGEGAVIEGDYRPGDR